MKDIINALGYFFTIPKESVNKEKIHKVYVALDKIFMDDHGIFLLSNGEYAQISNLSHDASGYFYGNRLTSPSF